MALIRPTSAGKVQNSDDHATEPRAAMQRGLTIGPFYKLLEERIYVKTKKRMIALCALRSQHGDELKLYEWE